MRLRQDGPAGRRWVVALLQVALLGSLTQTAASQPLDGQISSLSGWFHTVWGDRPPDIDGPESTRTITRYGLVDPEGGWTDLLLDETPIGSSEGLLAFNRR